MLSSVSLLNLDNSLSPILILFRTVFTKYLRAIWIHRADNYARVVTGLPPPSPDINIDTNPRRDQHSNGHIIIQDQELRTSLTFDYFCRL